MFFHISLRVEKGQREFSIVFAHAFATGCYKTRAMSIFPQLILNTTSKAEVKDQAKRIYLQWPIAADNIFTYLLYNINSTRHVAPVMIFKVYTGFLKKIINTLFSNATFVTQNQHSVTDASRTPRGCGFDVLECQKG